MTEVVTLGECLVSLVATQPGPLAEATAFERHIAGAEANVAVGLTRLGHSVAYVGRVGSDGLGTAIVRRLRGEGVDVTHLRPDPGGPTGVMFRERRVLGPADVVYARTGSAGSRLDVADVERAAADGRFAGARWLHVTGITPALSSTASAAVARAVALGREAGLTISLDINLRRRLWSDDAAAAVLAPLAGDVDIVLGSVDELAVVGGRPDATDPDGVATAVLRMGPAIVVVKLGDEGALAHERDGHRVHASALRVPVVVDPVGAGDAFCAGFIASRLVGADLAAALHTGNACGAAAVAAIGDLTGLPTSDEIERLLAAGTNGTPRGADTMR
jgi:2-dehydro-3-deoxygluconokinase